jgi:hypothetical protein
MQERVDAIDFWRGAALATIFINHIPGNMLGYLTPRNFGFSDSAEAFVFLSGLSVGLHYGGLFDSKGVRAVVLPLAKRARRLYFVHILLTAAALTLYWIASRLTGESALLADEGRSTPFVDPLRGWIGVVTLSHQIGHFNILPLYIVLLAVAPVFILIGRRRPWTMLAFSGGLYGLARLSGINAPSWPDPGAWYFNPAAWQLIFALGLFSGLSRKGRPIPVSPALYGLAHGVTLVGALVVSNGFGLIPGLVDAVGRYLDWDKTDLGVVRIVDFLALAYLVYCSGVTDRLRQTAFYAAIATLGRQALPVYCLGSLLSALGQILRDAWIASPAFDLVFVTVGLKGLLGAARALERRAEAKPAAP